MKISSAGSEKSSRAETKCQRGINTCLIEGILRSSCGQHRCSCGLEGIAELLPYLSYHGTGVL